MTGGLKRLIPRMGKVSSNTVEHEQRCHGNL